MCKFHGLPLAVEVLAFPWLVAMPYKVGQAVHYLPKDNPLRILQAIRCLKGEDYYIFVWVSILFALLGNCGTLEQLFEFLAQSAIVGITEQFKNRSQCRADCSDYF